MSHPANLWSEIDALGRRSKLVLAGALLKQARPSVQELAYHAGLSDQAVRDWITRNASPQPRKERTMAKKPVKPVKKTAAPGSDAAADLEILQAEIAALEAKLTEAKHWEAHATVAMARARKAEDELASIRRPNPSDQRAAVVPGSVSSGLLDADVRPESQL